MTNFPPTPPARHRFHLLDALRGLAAMFVISVHAPAYLKSPHQPFNAFMAVDFFFCLSGFVIAFSYERRLLQGFSLGSFIRARLTRLYPMYLLGAVTGLILVLTVDSSAYAAVPPMRRLVSHATGLLLLPNLNPSISPNLFPLDMPAWSLFFEILANIAYAALLYVRVARSWVLLLLAAISALTAANWVIRQGHLLGELGYQSNASLLLPGMARVAFSFLLGVLVLRLYRNEVLARRITASGWWLSCGIAIFLLFLLQSPLRFMQTSGFQLTCVAVLFPVAIFFAAHVRPPFRIHRVCVVLGEISYPIYLLHVFMLRPLVTHQAIAFSRLHPGSASFFLPVTVVLTAIVAYLATQLYETPLRGLLTRRPAQTQLAN